MWESIVKSLQSLMHPWGTMPSDSIGPLGFLKSNVITAVYQEIIEHLMGSVP